MAIATTAWLGAVACGQVEVEPTSATAAGPEQTGAIVALEPSSEPSGPDEVPRVRLARREPDGSLSPLEGEYIDAHEFRAGMAAVSTQRELHLVHRDGSRSVVAREVDGLPTPASDGSLVYAARYGKVVEIYRLTAKGSVLRLASFRGSATRLAPQPGGAVVFVGAQPGGVSGVWIADSTGARCLTNCELRVGQPWGDRYRALPGDTATVRISGTLVEWQTAAGAWESAPLEGNP
jgi:hypothetical protein